MLALRAAPAAASGGGEAGGIGSLVWPTINLLILIAALVYFARKPVQSFFADRRRAIQDELRAAADLLAQAEARHAECQSQLENLEAELDRLRAASQQMARSDHDRIVAEAEAAAERIRVDARTAVEQELRRAHEELREEAAALAVELAGERLREQVTEQDRGRLVDEFIERIEQDGSGSDAGRA